MEVWAVGELPKAVRDKRLPGMINRLKIQLIKNPARITYEINPRTTVIVLRYQCPVLLEKIDYFDPVFGNTKIYF